jgi:hypothetical protein
MIKFEGSEARNIEICSWAKRLPMFLVSVIGHDQRMCSKNNYRIGL